MLRHKRQTANSREYPSRSSETRYRSSQPFIDLTSEQIETEEWGALRDALKIPLTTGPKSVVIVTCQTDDGKPGDFAWAAVELPGSSPNNYGLRSELCFRHNSPPWATTSLASTWYTVVYKTLPYESPKRWTVPSDPSLFIEPAPPTDNKISATEIIGHVLEAVSEVARTCRATNKRKEESELSDEQRAKLIPFRAVFERASESTDLRLSHRGELGDRVAAILEGKEPEEKR
jgi:hypothetical protein